LEIELEAFKTNRYINRLRS